MTHLQATADLMTPDFPDPSHLPAGLKWLGGVGAALVAGFLFLRSYLSNARVERTVDEASVRTIERLQTMLEAERARADTLMREREQLIGNIGELRSQIAVLNLNVEHLTGEVVRLRRASEGGA